jgi:hypothetical protein
MDRYRKATLVAAIEIITALGLIGFWILFFTVGLAPENPPACYSAYEHSFPLADLVLAGTLLTAGILTLKRYPGARTVTHLCAGALVFLGLLDFSFNLQNGIYALSLESMLSNGFINLWCAGSGVASALLTLD